MVFTMFIITHIIQVRSITNKIIQFQSGNLPVIQVTIQLTDLSAIRLLLAIQLADMSDNRMPTV